MQDSFIIITPAFNEAAYIEQTIQSVVAQTRKPLLWVIVDDGSTDRTADIVKHYTAQYPWIQNIYRQKEIGQTYYASNVFAIQHGLNQIQNSKLKTQNYQFIAILDADISLPPDYYETILTRMEADPKLGIASGVYIDRIGEEKFRKVLNDRRSTPKALMVFRRQCFEEIGGFIPMTYGGEDTVACFTARMKGWKTWSFPDIVAVHNKPVGTGHAKGLFKIRFRQGVGEYFLGTHPLFMMVKSIRRCFKEPPYLVGGLIRLSGFVYAHFMKEDRQISGDLINFIRKEQLDRIFKGNKIPGEMQIEASE